MTTIAVSAPPAPVSRLERFRAWLRTRSIVILIVLLLLLLLLAYLWPDVAIEIGPGQAGVLWKRFDGGTVTVANDGRPFIGRIDADMHGEARSLIDHIHEKEDHVNDRGFHVYPYGEGTRLIWPWDEMFIYNIRLQEVSHTFNVLTRDGLSVDAEMSVSWKLIESDLGALHRDVGPNYVNVLLLPVVGASAREEIARYPPDALYSSVRLDIQERIRTRVKRTLLSRFYPVNRREGYIIVEDVLIRSVKFPPEIEAAIQEKVAQKHLAESYVYRIDREAREADRKAIEAEGIRRFQATVNDTISDGYLRWKGIDATLELARSPNSKVIVIGGKDGLPVVLGGLDSGAHAGGGSSARGTAVAPTPMIGPPAPPR
jgi:regulator of protease activity HflC (stomatin/prohibitin superfamily)